MYQNLILDDRIAEQLAADVSLNSAIQVRCGNSNAFNVTASTLIPLMQMFEMGGVYICASVGAAERIEEFKSIGLSDADISRIQFIDLVSSGILGGTDVEYNNIHFVDSPIMLESVLLRTCTFFE